MKRRYIIVAALAFALVLGMTVAPAGAYFTDHSTANGGMTIKVAPQPQIHEWYANKTKQIVITNAEDATMSVYARVRVYTSLENDIKGEGWTKDGDWYVYDGAIAPGGKSSKLEVKLTFPTVKSEEQPDGSVYGDNYNVEVIYEAVPVLYDADGNEYVDWDYQWDMES